jgi:FAD/FMN-containing dehydrogenase
MAQELDRPLKAAALAAFRGRLDGDVIATDDLEYDAARAVWNGIVDRRPALVARCTDAADVIKAVRFAREQDLVIAVRAGGHSVGGFSTCDGESLSTSLGCGRSVSIRRLASPESAEAPSAVISIEKPRLSGLPVLSAT